MKTALLAATDRGWQTAEMIHHGLVGSDVLKCDRGIKQALAGAWQNYDGIVCVMAAGIVVRCLAGLLRSKRSDPCVIVVDEAGNHVVSLLSGHIGGGNQLAEKVAEICDGIPVITTASDVSGHTAVDLWTIDNNLFIVNPDLLAAVSTKLLNSDSLAVYQEKNFIDTLPDDFRACTNPVDADIVISLLTRHQENSLQLIPRIRFIGFGCRRGATLEEFHEALNELEHRYDIDLRSVGGLASIDLKNDEEGLLAIAQHYGLPIQFFSKEQLSGVAVPTRSEIVHEKIGVYGVCEAAAILAASLKGRTGKLELSKIKWERITAAVAQIVF